MEKTVKFVKNSLKFKAHARNKIISVRVGSRKYVLPIEARILHHEDYLFLSFAAVSELFKIDGKMLEALEPAADASKAFAALTPGTAKKRGRKRTSKSPELPTELSSALGKLPRGHRLSADVQGNYRLVKMRKRAK